MSHGSEISRYAHLDQCKTSLIFQEKCWCHWGIGKDERMIGLKVKNLGNLEYINFEVTTSHLDLSYHSSLAWHTL